MKHVRLISRAPQKAASAGLCDAITGDFQARLCFLLQLLTSFFLPLFQIKNPTPAGEGEGEGEGQA